MIPQMHNAVNSPESPSLSKGVGHLTMLLTPAAGKGDHPAASVDRLGTPEDVTSRHPKPTKSPAPWHVEKR